MGATQTVYAKADSALDQLLAKGQRLQNLNYAGDITPSDTYEFLSSNHAVLVDVRTLPEWQLVGLPNVDACEGRLLTLSWKNYPSFALNPQFMPTLEAEKDISKDTPLFFICRSGGRSLDAAIAATQAGYRYCFNVTGGFEGEPDAAGHRGTAQGWKASQLPWQQG